MFTSNPAILTGSQELYLGRGFQGIPRVRGTACEPLYLANLMLLCLPWFIVWGLRARRWLMFAVCAVVLLFMTWSRGAWLAACLALGLGLLLSWRLRAMPSGRSIWSCVLFSMGGIAVVAAVLGLEAVLLPLRRLLQTGSLWDWSNLTRVYSMQAAWRAFTAAPLIGVGWGQFAYNYYVLVDIEGIQAQFDWPVANNILLLVLGETGLLGIGAFVAGAATLLRRTWRRLTPMRGGERLDERRLALVAGTIAGVAVWLQLLTFSQYNLPHIWVALGMWLACLDPCRNASLENLT